MFFLSLLQVLLETTYKLKILQVKNKDIFLYVCLFLLLSPIGYVVTFIFCASIKNLRNFMFPLFQKFIQLIVKLF